MTSHHVADKLIAVGTQPSPDTPEAFADFLKQQIATWSAVAKKNHIQVE